MTGWAFVSHVVILVDCGARGSVRFNVFGRMVGLLPSVKESFLS